MLLCGLASASAGDPSYTIATIAGAGFTGDGGPAARAELGSPEGLAFDRAGNLYIADAVDHRVRRISPEGGIATVAGNGRPGSRGDGGPASAAQLNAPYGLACDIAGNLYIADLGNARIRRISADGVIHAVQAAVSFVQPRNLALDAAGNLYVSDFGAHRVYRIAPDGSAARMAGSGSPGGIADNSSVEAALAPLDSPAGLAFSPDGALYIADSGNHRIRRVLNGRMTTVPAPASLNTPTGVAVDSSGGLYVAAKGSSAVLLLTPGAAIVAGTGFAGVSGDGGPATAARLTAPRELAFNAAKQLVIADARPGLKYSVGMLRRVAVDGRISTCAGGAGFRSSGDDGPAILGFLEAPSGLSLDADGALYIADRDDHRVRRIYAGGIATVAGIGFAGSGGDDGFAIRAQIDRPEAVAAGAARELWIAESGRLRRVTADGYIRTVAVEELHASGVAVSPGGDALVADSLHHVVRRVSPGGASTIVAGAGAPGYGGDGGAAAAALLDTPTGLSLDRQGNLYIADSGNGAIRRVAPGGVISTVAQGQWTPARVAADSDGALYVADTAHHRVWRVAPGAAPVVIAGTGSPGVAGDSGPALEAELNEPADVAIDREGGVTIADRGNGLIRRLAPAQVTPPPDTEPPPAEPLALEIRGVVNAASLLPGPVAPGEIVTLYGSGFACGGARVLFDGQPAEPLYVGATQINVRAPVSAAGGASTIVEVRVGDSVARAMLPAGPASPGLFTAAGGGQAAALNEDGAANSAARPAAPGAVATLYGTGEGVSQPLTVSIAELPAAIVAVHSADGVLRIDVRIPAACPSGAQPVLFTAGGAPSQPGVTLAIR